MVKQDIMPEFQLVECPRDAMQGIESFIPTVNKAAYINALMEVGFHTIDFGSFVSPKAVPQMKDSEEVLSKIKTGASGSNLLSIVVNERGAEKACSLEYVHQLGFPLSISETFQLRNANQSIDQAFEIFSKISSMVEESGKELVVYISMGFGNPYGDDFDEKILLNFIDRILKSSVNIISVSDTLGRAKPTEIGRILSRIQRNYPEKTIGAHLHAKKSEAADKVKAVIESGLYRMDGALGGYGGCPFADDELVGNIPTETIIEVLDQERIPLELNRDAIKEAQSLFPAIFPA